MNINKERTVYTCEICRKECTNFSDAYDCEDKCIDKIKTKPAINLTCLKWKL